MTFVDEWRKDDREEAESGRQRERERENLCVERERERKELKKWPRVV